MASSAAVAILHGDHAMLVDSAEQPFILIGSKTAIDRP
jgi:hypothetical protein